VEKDASGAVAQEGMGCLGKWFHAVNLRETVDGCHISGTLRMDACITQLIGRGIRISFIAA